MGILLTFINDENPITREEFNTVNDFMRLVVPITLQDIKEISQEEGVGEAILPGIIATFGIGMNYYKPKPNKKKKKKKEGLPQ